MIGGGGADLFVFGAGSHSRPNAPDLILDFSPRQGDQFDLCQLDADPEDVEGIALAIACSGTSPSP